MQSKDSLCWTLRWFPREAVTKDHKQGGLKQQKIILSQLWRLKVQNEDVCRAYTSSETLDRVLPRLFQLLVVLSNRWHDLACKHITAVSTSGIMWCSPCDSGSTQDSPFLIRIPVTLDESPP